MSQEEWTEGHSNKRPRSEPSLLLVNGDLWEKFHREGNEMIITKSGRCLFPLLQFMAVDLDPETMYSIDVDFEMLDRRRYRFIDGTWKRALSWKKSPSDEDEDQDENENENDDEDKSNIHFPSGLQESYTHPDLCQLGAHWMQKTISFSKIKLTNRIPEAVVRTQKRSKDPPTTSNHFFHLTSFHRYRPRVHLVQRSGQRRSVVASTTFTFDRTAFMAVTHYQNFRVNDLKKGYNPHAKGFRDTIQLPPSDSRAESGLVDSSRLRERLRQSRPYPATDSGSEGEETVKDENDEETGMLELDTKRDLAPLDRSHSGIVTRSRSKKVLDGNMAITTVRKRDDKAIKVEWHERTPSTLRQVSMPDQEDSTDNADHHLLTSSQTVQLALDPSLYEMVPLTTLRQSSQTRSSSRKPRVLSTLYTEKPLRARRSRRVQTDTGYGTVAEGEPLFRQTYLTADFQKANILQLTAPLTPVPEPIPSSELQLSPLSNGKAVSTYEPQASEAAVPLPIRTMASHTPISWYQQFFSWDQPSTSLTLPSSSPNALSIQDPCLSDSSTSMQLRLHSDQTSQEVSQHGLLSVINSQGDLQSSPQPPLDGHACFSSVSFEDPGARAIHCMPDLPVFAYEGDRLTFNCVQTDTCHIWPPVLESQTTMSTSSVFSVLPYYDGPEQMTLDMVLQENLRLKAFIRERYGSEAEAEANAVMVMGRHH